MEKTLMLGKNEGRRRREDKMVGWHHNSMDMSLSRLQEMVIGKPGVLWSMGLQRIRHY